MEGRIDFSNIESIVGAGNAELQSCDISQREEIVEIIEKQLPSITVPELLSKLQEVLTTLKDVPDDTEEGQLLSKKISVLLTDMQAALSQTPKYVTKNEVGSICESYIGQEIERVRKDFLNSLGIYKNKFSSELDQYKNDTEQKLKNIAQNSSDKAKETAEKIAKDIADSAKDHAIKICNDTEQETTKICKYTEQKTTQICNDTEKLVTERVLTLMGIFATIITVILTIGSVAGTWITSADSPNILFAFLVPVMITVITVTVLMGLIYTYSAVMTDNGGKARIIGGITAGVTAVLTAVLVCFIKFYPTDTPKSNAQTAFSGTVNASITYSANAADSDVPTDTQAETTDTQAVSETTSGFDTAVPDMTTAAAS